MHTNRSAFTLVELSIVLVILGLLVGGVLAGQSLIKAAELRSITNDLNKFQTAIHSFRDNYSALPGDMTNAFQFWGAAAACTDQNVDASGGAGCNGNGDGEINVFKEGFRAWQHLAMAGLVEGSYSGTAATAMQAEIGVNTPASKFNGGGYSFLGSSITTYLGWVVAAPISNRILIGRWFLNSPPIGGVLLPVDAWNIDNKTDDGLPPTGKIIGGVGLDFGSGCISGAGLTATYTINAVNASACVLAWSIDK